MTALLAGLPIAAILVLMVGLRWSAGRAGAVGVAVALGVSLGHFGFPGPQVPELPAITALGGTAAEAGFTALTILWIIGPALGIYELQLRTGSAEVLRAALASFAPDPRILALLVAWFFALFMEGAAGFGASVALAAPFLVAAGFPPVQAVTVALIGHAAGVSFGAIGTPVVPQVAATGLSGLEIARATGPYHALLGWIPLTMAVVLVARAFPTGGVGGARIGLWTAAAFVCFVLPYSFFWAFVGPELPTVGGALIGGLLFVGLLRWLGPAPDGDAVPRAAGDTASSLGGGAVARAAAPYLVLVGLVLVTRLVPPVREVLQGPTLEWEMAGLFSGSFQPFYHPGTMLLLGFVAGAVIQRAGVERVLSAVLAATWRLLPVAGALLAMLALSRLMVHAGMTEELALAASGAAGDLWPALAPFVGALGTFVTGSATASNILFTDFQRDTAVAVGLPVRETVGAQGFGAAVGNIVCPHNVVAAGATVGLQGREGEILRRTLGAALLYTMAGGALGFLLLAGA